MGARGVQNELRNLMLSAKRNVNSFIFSSISLLRLYGSNMLTPGIQVKGYGVKSFREVKFSPSKMEGD